MHTLSFKTFFFAALALGTPLAVFAQPTLSAEHISGFAQSAPIEVPEIVRPEIVRALMPEAVDRNQAFRLVNAAGEVQHVQTREFLAADLQPEVIFDRTFRGDLLNLTVGSGDSFVELPFDEEDAEENVVTITIEHKAPITTKSLSLGTPYGTQRPDKIRIAVLEANGEERVILPTTFVSGNQIYFPEVIAKKFTITLHYSNLLRIKHLYFHNKEAKSDRSLYLYFLARPDTSYLLYHGGDKRQYPRPTEKPHLYAEPPVVGAIGPSSANPSYQAVDSDEDGISDRDDNCVRVVNPDQVDIDNNGRGDACEDFDYDGHVNAEDNCPETTNPRQRDRDGDGKGDACDKEENRFLAQYPWIPSATIVIVAIIVMGIMMRTLSAAHKSKN